jgi:uncharacterized membrane protein YphA (DoxX/SURF4 family)
MTRAKAKTIAYWATTILGPASFAYGGVLHLMLAPEVVGNLHHLGYPTYFAFILGTGKLLGVIALLIPRFPRLKEWAYAGFFFDLSAGAFSRAAVGDSAPEIIAPLVFLALVMASWALRPDSRRLASAAAAAPASASTPSALTGAPSTHDRGFNAGTAATSIS